MTEDGNGRRSERRKRDGSARPGEPTGDSHQGADAPRVVREKRRVAPAENRRSEGTVRRDGDGGPLRGSRDGGPVRGSRDGRPVRGSRDGRPERGSRDGRPDRTRDEADDEYVLLPRSSSTQRRVLTVIAVVVLVIGTTLGGTLLWASRQINPSGSPGKVIELVNIPKGSSTPAIAHILAEHQVIASERVFTIYVGLKRKGGWKAGDYVDFRENSGFDDVIEILDAGPIPPASRVVRIQEGSRLVDALDTIADVMETVTSEQLQSTLDSGEVRSAYKPDDVSSWEGMLFPDTYQFAETDTPAIILQKMVTRMDEVLDSLGYDRAQALAGMSAHELITIASLIERETGQPVEERGMISRVISNRLDAGEPLGLDAPILYGLGRTNGELTRAELDQDTPYNTRIHTGLPPTPIGLPGESSLQAAIEPTPGDWKYYVLTSNDPPSHFFTSSYQEFIREKDDAQRRGVF